MTFRTSRRRHRAAGRRLLGGRLRPARRPAIALLALAAAATVLSVGGSSSREVQATADLSQFDPGNIISDQVFFFGDAMTEAGVASFIADKNRDCVTGYDGTPCLRDFRQNTTSRAADAYCDGYTGAQQETAAAIITKIAHSCDISPKVLLVMLQKEQSLVTASGSSLYASRYRSAVGYGCPDTAACDSLYYGFQNQLYSAARQFQRYAATPANWAYQAGRTVNVLWNPNTACGSAPVRIANQATAGLYNYTPYQPNAAALRAGYGSGDSCSSYGNRNFWLYFTDWFVSTQNDGVAASSPRGVLEDLHLTSSGFAGSGWTVDPDTDAPVTVRATVDGSQVNVATANSPRPDVAAALKVGPNHGFAITGLLSFGTHRVCIVADNADGPGVQTELGCQSLTFTNQKPQASIDQFDEQSDGSLVVSGWEFDPDGAPGRVDVYVDGQLTLVRPGLARPDVQASFPAAGPASGFSANLGVLPAGTQVCLYAVDEVAVGNSWLVQCQTMAYKAPTGWVDSVAEATDGQVHLTGWAMDASAPHSPVEVHVYVDGKVVTWASASAARDDVATSFPSAGAAHGFDLTIPAATGTHSVCVYAINIGVAGPNPLLGCRTVTLQYQAPGGRVDAVVSVGGGRLAVAGWAWDASVPTSPLRVDLYVDGRVAAITQAGESRPDIAAALPAAGPAHGFFSTLDVGYGRHQVCAYAINVGVAGPNPLLGCQTVDVAHLAPLGALAPVTSSGPGQLAVWGWAFDPDAPTAASSVRVQVDGVDQPLLTANGSRPDVGAAYPAAGPAHGFGTVLSVPAGSHQVCVTALSTTAGVGATSLGCSRVTA